MKPTIVDNRLSEWLRLPPIYFQKWMWQKAVQHQPEKYTMLFPVYQGCKVILT